MRSKTAFLAGAGAAYFLDPDAGKRRRHMARDRVLRLLRRLGRLGVTRVKLAAGRAQGAYAVARRSATHPEVAVDDATVLQRIRSDALRDIGLDTGDVDVRVADGVVTLAGTVPSSDDADRLVARVREVPGVADVWAKLDVAA